MKMDGGKTNTSTLISSQTNKSSISYQLNKSIKYTNDIDIKCTSQKAEDCKFNTIKVKDN